ncbi:ADOP family duplicated permease [uncultured Paludibaculum sp.]|uniref:ADOP family duplicated permease n=1 Tax=uncultured Paludibaculum sp. TaxID=1765020 RepID=UPI002AAB4140|nr:ADOP family duplicated permease [uncultured Paludibaculum sp.]
MWAFFQDIASALRSTIRHWGITATVAGTLGLGIGATTAVFATVEAMALRPLPYPDSDRLVLASALLRNEPWPISFPEFIDWQDQNRSFALMAAVVNGGESALLQGGEAHLVNVAQVSGSLFPVLGVQPSMGRTFLPEEDRPGAAPIVVLSHGLWQRRFSLDPRVLGRTLTIGSRSYQVVGVMPAQFDYPRGTDAWIALGPNQIPNRRARGLWIVGRLRPSLSLTNASDDMNLIAHRLENQYPVSNAGFSIRLEWLRAAIIGELGRKMVLLLAAASLLLLMACTNIAGVLLARGVSRRHEIALRMALGASRSRIFSHLLAECAILALGALAVGLLLSAFSVQLIRSLAPLLKLAPDQIRVGGHVLLFAVLASVCTVLIFGIVSVIQSGGVHLNTHLRGSWSTPRGGHGIQSLPMMIQLGVTTTLLTTSGLLLKSLFLLANAQPGFDPARIVSLRVLLPGTDPVHQAAVVEAIRSRLEGLPGARSVAAASGLPMGRPFLPSSFRIEGAPDLRSGDRNLAGFGCVTRGYVAALRIPLLQGEDFGPPRAQEVEQRSRILINRALARRLFPGDRSGSPVGRVLLVWGGQKLEIAGVIGDVPREFVTAAATPEIYTDCTVIPMPSVNFVIRMASGTHWPTTKEIKQQVRGVDATVPVVDVQTMDELLDQSMSHHRLLAAVVTGYGCISLLIAGVGLYGFMSYISRLRTREIAIKLALGAHPSDILARLLWRAVVLSVGGIALGLSGSWVVSRTLDQRLLYGIRASDPVTLAAVSVLVLAVLLCASFLPAYRSARLDPLSALRCE